MKFILLIRNYACQNLYVDTELKKFTSNENTFMDGWYSSSVYDFIHTFNVTDAPELLLQRKTDYYNFIDELKKSGYEEIKYIPIENK